MDKYTKEVIHSEFEKIKGKMSKDGIVSMLYGFPVDTNDLEMLVVSAYYMGQSEEMQRSKETSDTWRALLFSKR